MSFPLFQLLLHSLSSSIMYWGYDRLSTLETQPLVETQVGGHFQYLTIQGLAAAFLTMLLGLCADLLPTIAGFRQAQRTLMMIALPLTLVICLIYWPLILVAPNFILPPASDVEPSSGIPSLIWLPLHHDLALHACPALSLLVEFMVYHKAYTAAEVTYGSTTLSLIAGVWYGWWTEYCASYNGIFPYPFLNTNPLKIRIGIYMGATTLALVSFRVINALHPSPNKIIQR